MRQSLHHARKTHDLHKFRIDIGNVNALRMLSTHLSRTTIYNETFHLVSSGVERS